MSSHLSALAWMPIHSVRQHAEKLTSEVLGEQKKKRMACLHSLHSAPCLVFLLYICLWRTDRELVCLSWLNIFRDDSASAIAGTQQLITTGQIWMLLRIYLFLPKLNRSAANCTEAYFPTDFTRWFSNSSSPWKRVFPQRSGAVGQDTSRSCGHLQLTCNTQSDQYYFEALEEELTQKCVILFFQLDQTAKSISQWDTLKNHLKNSIFFLLLGHENGFSFHSFAN